MAINKVVYGGRTLIDLSSDTLDSASDLAEGVTAHDRSGTLLVGTGGGGGSSTLAGLDDVTLDNPQDDDFLIYDNGDWVNATIPIPTVTDTYDGTSSDAMSGKAVKEAIDDLDVTTSGAGAGKTVTALSQTNGKISATFSDISITKSQISDLGTIPTVTDTYNSSSHDGMSGVAVASAVSSKSSVSWSQSITTGQKIATVTIDGTPTDVYAPTSGGGGGGAVDSVNGQTGTVVLDVGDLHDATLSSLGDGDVLAYDFSSTKWKNKALSIPTVTDTYSGTSSDAMSGKAVKQALETLDVSDSAVSGQYVSAVSETDGKISVTRANLPSVPDDLNDLTDVAISSQSNGQVLTYDSSTQKWKNATPSSGGHEMIPVTNDLATIAALTDGDDDYVVNAYSAQRWSNLGAVTIVDLVAQGDDTLGTWTDTWKTDGVRTGWIWHECLYGILSEDVEVEPIFEVDTEEAVSVYAYRIDDNVTKNGVSGGAIALKLNAPIQNSNGVKVGVNLKWQRTQYIDLSN